MDCSKLTKLFAVRVLGKIDPVLLTGATTATDFKAFTDAVLDLASKGQINPKVTSQQEYVDFAKEIMADYFRSTGNIVAMRALASYSYNIEPEAKPEDTGNGPTSLTSKTEEGTNNRSISNYNIGSIQAKTVKPTKQVRNMPELGNTYFDGFIMEFNEFLRDFGSDVFNSTVVDFANGKVVKTNEDLNENIKNIKESKLQRLREYLGMNPETTAEEVLNQFEADVLNNTENTNVKIFNDKAMKAAYLDYVGLAHFDQIVSLNYSKLINKSNGQYKLAFERRGFKDFDDSFVDMYSQISHMATMIIEATPVVNSRGSRIPGRYLTTKEVLNVSNKLKHISSSDPEIKRLVGNLRISPEQNFRNLIRQILLEQPAPNPIKYGMTFADLDVVRSMYNYYFKGDNDPVRNGSNNDYSLLQMLTSETESNDIQHNMALTAITSLIDKTINQKYVTIEMTNNGLERRLTTELNDAIYYKTFLADLDNNANLEQNISNDKNNPTTIAGVDVYSNDGSYNVKIGGKWYNIDKNHGIDGDLLSLINYKSLNELMKGNDQAGIKPLVTMLSALTGLNLKENNYAMLGKLIQDGNAIPSMFKVIATMLDCRQAMFDHINDSESTIKDVANNLKVKFDYGSIMPFSYGGEFTSLAKTVAQIKAELSGDSYNQTSKNLNKDALPNNSMMALLFDYKTAFTMAEQSGDNAAIQGNMLVQNGNWDIVDGIVYRQDVKMRDGKVKSIKKFNSGEIAYQSLFSDVWGEFGNGRVMLQPIIYSDKPGQAMVVYNIDQVMMVDGKIMSVKDMLKTESSLLGEGFNLMDEMDFKTQQAQWNNLYNKLGNDYKAVLEHAGIQARTAKDAISKMAEIMADRNNDIVRMFREAGVDYQREFHQTSTGGVNTYMLSRHDLYNSPELYKRKINQANKKFITQFAKMVGDISVYSYNKNIDPTIRIAIEQYIKLTRGNEPKLLKGETKKNDESTMDAIVRHFVEQWSDDCGYLKLTNNPEAMEITNIYEDNVKPEINPLLGMMQSMHRGLSKSFNMAMVGGEHGHLIKLNRDKVLAPFKPISDKGKLVERTDNPENYIFHSIYERIKSEHPSWSIKKCSDATLDEIYNEIEESARLSAMLKRMVSYQAKLHPITQKLITGIPQNVHMAVMEDIKENVFNSIGSEDSFKVSDGGGWVPMVCSLLMKNSMGDAGLDTVSLKAIRHALDGDTQIAHLDKYAAQALCNETLRRTDFSTNSWQNLNKFMLGHIQFNEILNNGNIFELLWKGAIQTQVGVDPLAWAANESSDNLPSFLNGKISYMHEGMCLTEVLGVLPMGNNTYAIKKRFKGGEGLELGTTIEEGVTMVSPEIGVQVVQMNNLYDVWTHMLGGAYSVEQTTNTQYSQFKVSGEHYAYTDASHQLLADLMNNVMIKQGDTSRLVEGARTKNFNTEENNSGLVNQDTYYQPLKDCIVWQVNNDTGMKNGAKNPNKNQLIKDGTSTGGTFTTNTMWWGIQGNFDHGFDEEHQSEVSEPTQMISACETMGIMTNDVARMYDALATVIKLSLEDKVAAFENDQQLYDILAQEMINQMRVKDRIGLGNAWAAIVDERLKEFDIKPEDAQALKIALSDGNFYGAAVSMISGSFNSGTIRRKTSGIAAVLSQGHNAIMMVDGQDGGTRFADSLRSDYQIALMNMKPKELNGMAIHQALQSADQNIRTIAATFVRESLKNQERTMRSGQYGKLAKWQMTQLDLTGPRINPYDNLRITLADGSTFDFTVKSMNDYYALTDGRMTDVKVFKDNGIDAANITGIYAVKGVPRNLRSQYLNIVTEAGVFNEMDLPSARVIYNLKAMRQDPDLRKIAGKYDEELLTAYKDTYDINESKQITNLILRQQKELIDIKRNRRFAYKGKVYEVSATNTSVGEVVLPNVNASKYGIKEGMALNEVTEEFFKGRFFIGHIKKAVDKGLRELNGVVNTKTVYLNKEGRHIFGVDNIPADVAGKAVEYDNTWTENGRVYYVDDHNNKLMEKTDSQKLYRIDGKLVVTGYPSEIGGMFGKIPTTGTVNEVIAEIDIAYNSFINNLKRSWDHQLQVIGSRIPTQALQSIMTMKIVGFTERHINRAYLPIKKNVLDGSDFS